MQTRADVFDVGAFMELYRLRYSMREAAQLAKNHQHERGFEYTHVIIAQPNVRYLSPVVISKDDSVDVSA